MFYCSKVDNTPPVVETKQYVLLFSIYVLEFFFIFTISSDCLSIGIEMCFKHFISVDLLKHAVFACHFMVFRRGFRYPDQEHSKSRGFKPDLS